MPPSPLDPPMKSILNNKLATSLLGWRPLRWEILDPPLVMKRRGHQPKADGDGGQQTLHLALLFGLK